MSQLDYLKSHGVPQQLFNPPVLATSLYDQLWGLALAVNSSLPELQRNNISIDALEQHQLTHIIENHLLNLSFQGCRLCPERSVSTPVQLFVSSESEQVIRQVGTYNLSMLQTFTLTSIQALYQEIVFLTMSFYYLFQ